MSNNRETLKKEMEEYLDQFENVVDVPMATLTERSFNRNCKRKIRRFNKAKGVFNTARYSV